MAATTKTPVSGRLRRRSSSLGGDRWPGLPAVRAGEFFCRPIEFLPAELAAAFNASPEAERRADRYSPPRGLVHGLDPGHGLRPPRRRDPDDLDHTYGHDPAADLGGVAAADLVFAGLEGTPA